MSNGYSAMRTALIALGIVAIGLFAIAAIVDWQRVEVPPVGPSVEQICAEAMQRAPADLSWVAPNRAEKVRGREIKAVTLGGLPGHTGSLVRVAGVLHAEFEWVALYPSRAAIEEQPWRSPWVRLTSLWPDEPYWRTKGPSISDRCVVVEGTYSGGAGGHFGMFNGTIDDVLRLDVWSTPHRPFVTTPPPPPPPADVPCSEKPVAPKPTADAGVWEKMLAEFNKLYETGEFQLGYCLADVQVNERGTVDTVRIVRPQNVDKRVESVLVRSMKSGRYTPATACGRPVPFALSVGVGHCPSRTHGRREPDRQGAEAHDAGSNEPQSLGCAAGSQETRDVRKPVLRRPHDGRLAVRILR